MGRELADILADLKRPPPTRPVRVAYGTVISLAPPYVTIQFADGFQTTMPYGAVRPIIGKTWRCRQILGSWIADDWAATRDLG